MTVLLLIIWSRDTQETGGNVVPYTCDIRKQDHIDNMLHSFTTTYGNVDYLVNNGGGQFIMPAEMMSPNGWDAGQTNHQKVGPML